MDLERKQSLYKFQLQTLSLSVGGKITEQDCENHKLRKSLDKIL